MLGLSSLFIQLHNMDGRGHWEGTLTQEMALSCVRTPLNFNAVSPVSLGRCVRHVRDNSIETETVTSTSYDRHHQRTIIDHNDDRDHRSRSIMIVIP